MKKLFLFSLLTACGYDPCIDANFTTSGLCVITNGYRVTPEMVDVTVTATENAFGFHEVDIDLVALLEENNVAVFFVDRNEPMLLPDNTEYGKDGYIGRISDHIIWVEGSEVCNQYYVLGHELLHFVARHVLNVSTEESRNHTTPDLFFDWAHANGEDVGLTVEGIMMVEVFHACDRTIEHFPPKD